MKMKGFLAILISTNLLFANWINKNIEFNEAGIASNILEKIASYNNTKIEFQNENLKNKFVEIDTGLMPIEGVFTLAIHKLNFQYRWIDKNTIYVYEKGVEDMEFIQLYDLNTSRLKTILNKGYWAKNSFGHLSYDNELNAVIIKAIPSKIEKFKSILTKLENSEKLRKHRESMSKKVSKFNQQNEQEQRLMKKYNLDKYDNSLMVIETIPLKYINTSLGEVYSKNGVTEGESLEEILRRLLEVKVAENNISSKSENESYLKVDTRTNSIIVKDYPSKIAQIKEIIKGLDKKTELIEIEVTIVSVNDSLKKQFKSKLVESKIHNDGFYPIADPFPFGLLSPSMLFIDRKTLNRQLDAMKNNNIYKILSNPHIITLNHRKASIISGNSVSVPIVTQEKMSLETIDTGISIKAIPHIISENNITSDNEKDILLEIYVEKSDLNNVTSDKIETSQNKIDTHAIIKNGQTLVLGGLFNYTKNKNKKGIPILKDVPLFGTLFSNTNESLIKSELLFFITPKIVENKSLEQLSSNGKDLQYKDELFKELENKDNVKKIENEKTKPNINKEVEKIIWQ